MERVLCCHTSVLALLRRWPLVPCRQACPLSDASIHTYRSVQNGMSKKSLDDKTDTAYLAIPKATDFEERPLATTQQSMFKLDIMTCHSQLMAVI